MTVDARPLEEHDMPTLGGPELLIILLVFILLFGAKKLPDLGSSVGKSIKNFKKGIDEGKEKDAEPRVDAPPPPAASSTTSGANGRVD